MFGELYSSGRRYSRQQERHYKSWIKLALEQEIIERVPPHAVAATAQPVIVKKARGDYRVTTTSP